MRWDRVEQLAERATSVAELQVHGLELVALRRLRARGAAIAPQLAASERLSAVIAMAAPVLLTRARDAYDGRMALMKGPEIAARYPDPALRMYSDIDLLVDDAGAAHRALRAAGFEPSGLWAEHVALHHLQPLCWPGLPITLELHARPHFPGGLRAPATSQLLAGAVPARFGGGRVDALAPAAHTLVVAAHSWAHAPLANIGQLVDVGLLAEECDRGQLDALARGWGCERMWHATIATTDALLDGAPLPVAARVLAPHLRAVRERTLLERHIEELASPLFGLPRPAAVTQTGRVLARRLRPAAEETWPRKLARARRALRHGRLAHSEHEARLPAEDLHVGGVQGLQAAPLHERRPAP